MNTSFYLETKKDKDNKKMIMLNFSYNGKRLRYSTGIKIAEDHWNKNKHCVRQRRDIPEYSCINETLEKLRKIVEKTYMSFLPLIPTTSQLKKKIKKQVLCNQNTIEIDLKEFIEEKKNEVGEERNKTYKSELKHFIDYCKKKNIRLTYDNLDEKFLEGYTQFFINKGHQNSTIKIKHLKTLKVFLNWSVKKGYNKNLAYQGYSFPSSYKMNNNTIFLTEKELIALYNFDFSDNETLDKARDIFCFECFTGLRISDLSTLKKENVADNTLTLVTKKTNKPIYSSIPKVAQKILDKYLLEKRPLPAMKHDYYNQKIKEACELAGITKLTEKVKHSGLNRKKITKPKSQFIASHVARHTFITLMSQQGVSDYEIMAISTHTSYNVFAGYKHIEQMKGSENINKAWNNIFENKEKQNEIYTDTDTINAIKQLYKNGVDILIIANAYPNLSVKEIKNIAKQIKNNSNIHRHRNEPTPKNS